MNRKNSIGIGDFVNMVKRGEITDPKVKNDTAFQEAIKKVEVVNGNEIIFNPTDNNTK